MRGMLGLGVLVGGFALAGWLRAKDRRGLAWLSIGVAVVVANALS